MSDYLPISHRLDWTDNSVQWLNRAKATKYSDTEPRDDHGRWTSSGSDEEGGFPLAHDIGKPADTTGGQTTGAVAGMQLGNISSMPSFAQEMDGYVMRATPLPASFARGIEDGMATLTAVAPGLADNIQRHTTLVPADMGKANRLTQAATLSGTHAVTGAGHAPYMVFNTGTVDNSDVELDSTVTEGLLGHGDMNDPAYAQKLVANVFLHESGHVLDAKSNGALTDAMIHVVRSAKESSDGAGNIVPKAANDFLRKSLSKYATSSAAEAVAEAFQKYALGQKLPKSFDPLIKAFKTAATSFGRKSYSGTGWDEWANAKPKDVILLDKPSKALKYSDTEPRDDHGRWTDGGGDAEQGQVTTSKEDWLKANPAGNGDVFDAAVKYVQTSGKGRVDALQQVTLPADEGKAIADAYDAAKDDPKNPETQAAYKAFNAEVEAQRKVLVAAGFKYEPWEKPGQPYANSAEMRADVMQNHHLYYFKSDAGSPPNALMSLQENDAFRMVHDTFGHALGGNQFGPKGETNAFVDHSQMFTPLARRAMATETIGQNAWFNFGKANEGKPVSERGYAEQKATLLDPKLYEPIIARAHSVHKHVVRALDDGDDGYLGCPCHRPAPKTTKYSDTEPRDDHGRWTSGSADFAALADRLSRPDSGFTISTTTGSEPSGAGHYAVNIYPELSKVVSLEHIRPVDIYNYMRKNDAVLTRPGHYMGGWHDPETGKIWLDVSVVTKDRAQAEQMAKAHDQIAYFDFGTGKSVRIGENHGEGKAGAVRHEEHHARAHRGTHRQDVYGADGSNPVAFRHGGLARRHRERLDRELAQDVVVLRKAGDDAAALTARTYFDNFEALKAPSRTAGKQEPELIRSLVLGWQAARRAIDVQKLAKALEAKDIARAAHIVNAGGPNTQMKSVLTPRLVRAFLYGVQHGMVPLAKPTKASAAISLDGFNQAAVDWAEENAAKLVQAASDQQEIIRLMTAEAETGSATYLELAQAVRTVVGLTVGQAQAVQNYMDKLEASDNPPSASDIADMAGEYADSLLRYRSMTIARTELMQATNAGQQEVWDQAVSNGLIDSNAMVKMWIVTDDHVTCDECDAMDGETTAIDDSFSSGDDYPPLHPNCRCTVGLTEGDSGDDSGN